GKDSIGQEGIQDVQKTMEYIESVGTNNLTLDLDFTLARGLDYYTGMIFEAVPKDGSMGTIAGGGRYDELTEFFGLKDVSGIGISFGIERIYDMMETKKLFPDQKQHGTQVLLANFGEAFESFTFAKLQTLRNKGIASEIYPNPAKMGKQFKYADKSGIPYVIVIGSEEKESGEFQLKNMQTGEQDRLTFESILATLKNDFD
ncbi:MAG: histidine--tRNA ligase, partial [Bacteroidetes bacterium SW_10_40_5]